MKHNCIVAGAILILITIFNLALPNKVYACLCGPDDHPVEEARAKADAIFVGKVIGITKGIEKLSALPDGIGFEDVTLEVTTAWKGVSQPQVTIRDYSTDCGFEFQEAGSYLVYADRYNDVSPLSTGKCMRTRPITVADADLTALGQGRVMNQSSPLGDIITPALGFLLLFVAATLAVVMFRHKGRSRSTTT